MTRNPDDVLDTILTALNGQLRTNADNPPFFPAPAEEVVTL
jgi:hypothetical protein